MVALPAEEIEITASARVRVLPADSGSMFVDSATAFGRMKELAGALEYCVLAMAKNAAIILDHFGKAFFGLFVGYREARGETFDVAPGNQDVVVRAAIPRTLGTVIEDWKRTVCHMIDGEYLPQMPDKLQPQ